MLIKQNQLVINGTTLEQSDLQAIANVASDVQAQIDTKAPINNAQFTGNVGIGETSPDEKLEVNGSFKIGNLKIQNANGGRIGFNRNTANGDIYDSNFAAFQINGAYSGADFMAFEAYTSGGVGTDAMVIKDNGNVGIGFTSPNEKLHVNGHIEASAGYKLASHPVLDYTSFDGGYSTRLGSTGTSTLNATQIFAGGSVQATFKGGNVGIGTTSPQPFAKLEVAGSAGAQTGANQAFCVRASTATANEGVGIRLSAASGSHEAVGIIGMVNNATGNAGSMTFHTYNLGATIDEHMRIDNTGNIGIGTVSPNSVVVIALYISEVPTVL